MENKQKTREIIQVGVWEEGLSFCGTVEESRVWISVYAKTMVKPSQLSKTQGILGGSAACLFL